MYNASEMALQQLIQVAGRAGRQSEKSLVIVQTMVEHSIFDYMHEVDYLSYYTQELELRTALHYPPLVRLVEIELKHSDEVVLEQEAALFVHVIRKMIQDNELEVTVLGPAKPPVHKIKNWHSRKLYLKSAQMQELQLLFQAVDKKNYQSSIFFTPNPLC
jgi:primosomal protein N' (replication factor Y)